MREKSVSICIPAYNEEGSLDRLLKLLLKQKKKGFLVREIIVASDGSTDSTAKIALKYKKYGVRVIIGKVNRGQTHRQNEILSKVNSDILVLMNADIKLTHRNAILDLVTPIMNGSDLSAQWARPHPPQTFIERILFAGFELKYYVYTHYRGGNNIYTCVGHMRALSRRFYSKVVFPKVSEGEDQFLYLACIKKGYKYEYSHEPSAFFKLPDNFSDYKKYAKRIFHTQRKFVDIYTQSLVESERKIPIKLQFMGCMYGMLKNPFFTPLYILLHFMIQRWAFHQPENSSHAFEVSSSTKSF